ncbi:hypothetical protein BH10ACT7_BH10ACT7_11650 [soil metagenome]
MRPVLTVVHGPAGSGKSTMLAQWARTESWENENLVWVTLYPDDAGIVPFWKRIGDALVQADLVAPDFSLESAAGDFSRMLLGSLSELRAPLTLVLDDYHLVASEGVDRQLRLLLEQLDGFRVLVGTRVTSGLHSIELAARVSTALIDAESLAFTLDESRALVDNGGLQDREGLAEAIHAVTGGWPLASQALIVEAHRFGGSPLMELGLSSGSVAFASEFARSALASRPQDERDFLLRLSLADEVTVELGSELTGTDNARTHEVLSALERDGVGTWQSRRGVSWFRIHPLLREALETDALAHLEESKSTSVRAALSDRLERDRPLRALELAVAISDWVRVERLVLLHWVTYSYYNRAAYQALLGAVPAPVLKQYPALMATRLVEDYNAIGGNLTAMLRQYSQLKALDIGALEPTVTGALRELMLAGTHRLFSDVASSVAGVERALSALGASDPVDRNRNASSLPILHAHAAVTHFFDRQNLRAIHGLTRGTSVALESGSGGERFQALGLMAFLQAARGDLPEARVWMQRCEEADPYDGWVGGYLQAPYLIAKSIASLNEWDAQRALDPLDLLAFTEPVIEYWPWMATARATAIALTTGPAAAHATLAETLARKQHRPAPPPAVLATLVALDAQLLLLDGQSSRASARIEGAGLEGQPEIDLVRARIASFAGDHLAAIALADPVLWSSTESPALRAEALLTLASAAFDAGLADRAAQSFGDALDALASNGLRLPLLWIGPARLTELATLAHEQGRRFDASLLDGVPELSRTQQRVEPLSKAERRVLAALIATTEVAAAAELLHLSTHTVRYHLKRSYRKLGVSSRAEAIAVATKLGLLSP